MSGHDLDRALYQFQRSDEETYTKQLATQYGLPYVNLLGYPILPNTLHLASSDDLARYQVIPYLKVGAKLKVALTTPTAPTTDFLQKLANQTGLEIILGLCSPTSFKYGLSTALVNNQVITSETISVNRSAQQEAMHAIASEQELREKLAHASATQALDILFAGATGMEASDIHVEPQENTVRVRYRIDGVLQEIAALPPVVYHQIVSRVKFLSHMKMDVKKVNQDGRFTITLANTTLDVRVSTLPSTYGEVIDMRLLRAHTEFIHLDALGVSTPALDSIKAAMTLPHGMILVTGPTGSGKTTTLYAILQELNQPGVKIITLEDPIEYRLSGIDQVQIESDQGFTFAEALKGVLRQDPDIIMVGEIRDKETADIGLQAAMTGHLFLSTLHTNNAPASLARLIDMGVEPYKIAGAINLIIGQRLVRKVCTDCQGTGCTTCHKTGYHGRLPILEILKPSKILDEALLKKASVRDLYQIAQEHGMESMHDDGMKKVAQGLTTKEEVERVTAELDLQD